MMRAVNVLRNAPLVVASTLIALWAADFTLKFLELPTMNRAVMLLSGSKLYTDNFGVRRYEANKDVEQAAVINGELAYRYKYRTNNLGLVSKYDIERGRALDLMIVGDSFTEGQEVGPWIDVIQQRMWEGYGKTSQNFAISGNGFVEFERAAAFARTELAARKAMLVFIGGDMLRPGDFVQANKDCSTYRTLINSDIIDCLSGNSTWFHYDAKLSDDALISFSKTWQRFGFVRTMRKPVIASALAVSSWTCRAGIRLNWDGWMARRYQYHCDVTKAEDDLRLAAAFNGSSFTDSIPAYTISALEKILRLYGSENVLLVAIPGGGTNSIRAMQPEAVFNRALRQQLKSPIQFVDISESCEMDGLWAPRPGTGPRRGWGHLTPEGYRKLQSCLLASDKIMQFVRS